VGVHVSKGLGPVQKKILELVESEKQEKKYSYIHGGVHILDVVDVIAYMYDIKGSEEERYKKQQKLDIVKKQRIYNSINRLDNRELINVCRGSTNEIIL